MGSGAADGYWSASTGRYVIMIHRRFPLVRILLIFCFVIVTACADDDHGDGDDQLISAECLSIREDCKAFAKVESWEHECTLTEPETQGCLIEKEGYYNQTYYDCAKQKIGSKCEGAVFQPFKCLANCYYEKIDYETYAQAEEECMDLCVYSVDY
jgi:hypothetical protein